MSDDRHEVVGSVKVERIGADTLAFSVVDEHGRTLWNLPTESLLKGESVTFGPITMLVKTSIA